jgi:Uma2 family endonuclease
VVPDLAGWRYERMPVVDDAPFETLAPDWICETPSGSTEKLDRQDKMPIYAAAGVGHAWLAHPARRTLEVFQLHGDRWRTVDTHQGDQWVRAAPFAAIELDISMLCFDLAPPRTNLTGELIEPELRRNM